MDNSFLRQQRLGQSNSYRFAVVKVTGASLTTSSSSAGVTVGKELVNAKDDGSNTVTLTYKEPLLKAAYAWFQGRSTNAVVLPSSITSTTTSLVYQTVQGADYSTGSADADMDIWLMIPDSIDLV